MFIRNQSRQKRQAIISHQVFFQTKISQQTNFFIMTLPSYLPVSDMNIEYPLPGGVHMSEAASFSSVLSLI